MDPTLLLSAAGQAPGALGAMQDLMNLGATQATNAQAMQFQREMYQRQRADALEFWGMQNAYNSPAEQMKRYQAAGLNPNLIYGQSNLGGGIQVPDASPVNFREPKAQGSNLRVDPLTMADLRIKNAQATNLETQTEVIRQDARLRAWQAERAGFDFEFEKGLVDVSADARRASLRKMNVETDVLLNRDAREAAMNASSIQEAASRMLTMAEQRKGMPLERGRVRADTDRIREQIKLMEQDGTLKKMDITLREKGINPSDPLWARYTGMFLSDIYEGRVTAGDIGTSIWRWLTE